MSFLVANFVGIGLYTPAEAARLLGLSAGKLVRWLRGHSTKSRDYRALWHSQVNLDDGKVYLGFRDLMEARVVSAFMKQGLSAQKVRRAIDIARDHFGDHPLSTRHFCTDGSSVFLYLTQDADDAAVIDLLRRQYAFEKVIAPSLKGVEFDAAGVPTLWFPLGHKAKIVLDPERSFGHPIDQNSGVPTAVLAAAAEAEGDVDAAAAVWGVSVSAVKRAVEYEDHLHGR